jgi:hypothetical protein
VEAAAKAAAAAARAHRRAIMDSMEPAAAVAVPSTAARTLYSLRTIGPETARSTSQRSQERLRFPNPAQSRWFRLASSA